MTSSSRLATPISPIARMRALAGMRRMNGPYSVVWAPAVLATAMPRSTVDMRFTRLSAVWMVGAGVGGAILSGGPMGDQRILCRSFDTGRLPGVQYGSGPVPDSAAGSAVHEIQQNPHLDRCHDHAEGEGTAHIASALR